jgi:outer membrane lipoprotein SlyB
MKQVVFAVLLLAMVSLTGCLSGDEETEDNSVYNPNKNSSINIPDNMTVVKSGNRITTKPILEHSSALAPEPR